MASTARELAASSDFVPTPLNLADYVPASLRSASNDQKAIPAYAKNPDTVREIETALQAVPTHHRIFQADARELDGLADQSVHVVVTSPPYWTLKEYRDSAGQLGHVEGYEEFLDELDRVWRQCYRLLVPGGRLICNVGDVCLSRRENEGRHTVVPLHASIQERRREMGPQFGWFRG